MQSLMEPRQFAAQVPLQLILKDLQALEADQTSADLQLHEALLQITTTRENNCLQKRKIKRIVDLVSHILDTENDSFVVLHEAWLAASRQPIVEESRDDLKQQRDERSSSLCRTLESLSALSKGADRAATFISTASANRVPSNAEEPSANLLLTGTAAALCTLPINDNDLPKFEAIVPAKLTIHSEFNASSTIAALAPPTLLSNVHMTACPTPSTAAFLSVERDEFPKTNLMPVQKNVLPQPPKVVESSLTELDAVTSTMPLILSVPLTKASLPVSSAAEPIISVVRAEFIQKDDKIVQLCGKQNALVFGQIGEEGVDVGFPKKHMEAKHFKIYQKVSEPWKAGGSTFRYRNVPCVDVLVAKFFISKNSLGDGATGKVVAIKDRMTGMLWAAKIPESRNLSVLQAFRREAEILAKLKNRSGIVQLQEVLEGDGQIYIILEYLPRGSLEDFINASGPASEAVVKTWVLKMVEILQLLDDMGIIHQDWKPSNLVFDSTMNLKLIDFGCGKEAVSSTLREGTVSFMAPEVLERKEHDQRAELYSLGLIIVYSLCGESLWGCEATEKEISSRMKLGALTLQKIDHISKDGCHLIETLLAYDRDGRPRLEEIRNHKWFSIDNRYEKTTSKFSYIHDTASRTNFILVRDLMKSADLRKAVQGFSIEGMVYEDIDQSFKDAFNQMKISEPEVTSTKRAIPLHAANLTIIEAWCNSNAHSLNLVKDARKRLLVMEVKEIVF
ncbi:kinase-like protein [Rhizoclosmatium globosum]|uniref:Kinase-like protein n=1 Tax=Rhizoclosmatium globosum TaxID=329046 RepID=A0A1Y2BLY3_9FUNG|nr:kinase-like protein [Rhizoclosmatium globosum]|eukprot:ORY35155.1 kinase-like protein [Rhizoclosmatium globosum]